MQIITKHALIKLPCLSEYSHLNYLLSLTGGAEVSLQIPEVSRVNFWLHHGLVHPLAQ